MDETAPPITPSDKPALPATLRLLQESDCRRLEANALAVSEPEHDPGREQLVRMLQPAANDSLTDLVIVGWGKGVLDLVLGDGCRRAKNLTWIVTPSQFPHLLAAHAAAPETVITVALCEHAHEVPMVLERLPLCWSFAALDTRLGEPHDILRQAWYRFVRRNQGPERTFGDLRHLVARLPRLPAALPLKDFADSYRGEAALCLAAGPSLDRRLPFIRAVQDRCVVIAVDVILNRVQAAGVKVDFVLNVDSSEKIVRLITACADPQTVMVMPLLSHRALDAICVRTTYSANEALADWLLGDPASFSTGSTVGIATVGFAHYLGCREVVICGQDLAFAPNAYYSEMVDRAKHEADQVGQSAGRVRPVMGNSGEPVPTNINFEVAIQDLTSLLQRFGEEFRCYNPNCDDRIGARIPGSLPLPADWQPARREPLPRPHCERTLAANGVAERCAGFAEQFRARGEDLLAFWEKLRNQDPNGFSHFAVPDDPALHIPLSQMLLFDRGPVYHMVRLHALPPSITVSEHHRELEDFVARASREGLDLIVRSFDPAGEPLDPQAPALRDTGLTQEAFSALFARIALDDESSMDQVLMPAMATNFLNLRLALPALGLPAPHSANEGLCLAQSLGLITPRQYLVQTLCLCALESEKYFAACLDWGHAHGLLAEHDLLATTPAAELTDRPPWLVAAGAVLRLRHRTSADLAADAALALEWHPARLTLLRTLLELKPEGIAVLEALLEAGRLTLDDQLGALLLVNHPDSRRAAELLEPHQHLLGEATTLAIAHREFQRGNYQGALVQVDGIRVLSRFRDQALSIACRCYLALGRGDLVTATLPDFIDLKLRATWEGVSAQASVSG